MAIVVDRDLSGTSVNVEQLAASAQRFLDGLSGVDGNLLVSSIDLVIDGAITVLAEAGLVSKAEAAAIGIEGATVQTVQYYGGYHERWREHEWRRHERHRAWHHWHRWHHG